MKPDPRRLSMARIPAGEFVMGSRPGHGDKDEFPEHPVWVDEFLMARFPVTASMWAVFLNESGFTGFEPGPRTTVVHANGRWAPLKGCGLHPANGVDWEGAGHFIGWLNQKTGLGYRLPSEAEWERAARGGRDGFRYPWGNEPPLGRAQFARPWVDPAHTLAPVDAFGPNPYGLHDLVGNVWEWCADWYDYGYYAASPLKNPQGPPTGQTRVMRGGSFGCLDVQVRCAIRVGEWPSSGSAGSGFRLAR